MNESGFTRAVNKLLPQNVFAWKINARYAGGVPDCWYSSPDGDMWVEFKYLPKLPKKLTAKLSALQKQWLAARHQEGRNVAVIVGSPEGSVILQNMKWLTQHIVKTPLTKAEVAAWIKTTLGNK
jgi:hypothetical protein